MAQVDCIGPMKIRRDSIALAAEASISTPVFDIFSVMYTFNGSS